MSDSRSGTRRRRRRREPDPSVLLVDAGKVDFGDEVDGGRLVGVAGTAVDLETVDAVLVGAL